MTLPTISDVQAAYVAQKGHEEAAAEFDAWLHSVTAQVADGIAPGDGGDGSCWDVSPQMILPEGQPAPPRMLCDLRVGHRGAHSSGGIAQWGPTGQARTDAQASLARIRERLTVSRLGKSFVREADEDLLVLSEAAANIEALIGQEAQR